MDRRERTSSKAVQNVKGDGINIFIINFVSSFLPEEYIWEGPEKPRGCDRPHQATDFAIAIQTRYT